MITSAPQAPVFLFGMALLAAPALTGQTARDDALAKLGAYVDAWERELGSVVADEAYSQLVTRVPRSGVVREPNAPPRQSRELSSEFTLIHFDEGVADWIGFRAVKVVDGKAVVAPGPSLNQVLNDPTLSWQERWRRVRDMSAALNIGSIARDVNLPTFALAALRTVNHSRFSYSRRRSDTVDGECSPGSTSANGLDPRAGLRGRWP